MKKILSLIGLALLGLAFNVCSQVGTFNFSITNLVVSNATSTTYMGNAMDISQHGSLGLVFSSGQSTNNLDVATITLIRSADNSVWETTPGITWGVTPTMAGFVAVTNIDRTALAGFGYIKVKSIQNAAGYGNLTNCILRGVVKKGY